MSANLSTVEQFGVGFERTGIPFTPWLNQTKQMSEGAVEEQISQVPSHRLPPPLRRRITAHAASTSNQIVVLPPSEVLSVWLQAGSFDGLLIIPDAPFAFPPQRFSVSSNDGKISIESHPSDAWPQILLEFKCSPQEEPTVERVQFRPSDNTVESEILYTRAHYVVSQIGSYMLASEITSEDQVVGISFNCQPLQPEQANTMLYRAKIARKLRFIERVFNLREVLPEDITPNHVQYIESIFRGLTEGEFTTRGDGVTVLLRAADVDLNVPPFSEAGAFEYLLGNEQALLFQQDKRYTVLDVGPYYLKLQRAVIANRNQISRLRGGHAALVRFEVLDSQITYRYERYARAERHKRIQQKLKRFHDLLSSEEPIELANTLFDPLISDVKQDQAIKIAVGWLQYHDFPDRFTPQEPTADSERACWRVPIYVVYANGKGARVGELLIDLKTGSIIDEPSPELMHREGLALGEKILRVS